MDAHVEVSVSQVLLGTAPPSPGSDQEPNWNFAFRPQEFEVGDEILVRVFDKNAWPRKDVLIGVGTVALTAAFLESDRRATEMTVELWKSHDHEPQEHTGDV